MSRLCSALSALALALYLAAPASLAMLPDDADLDPDIPSPADVLGFEPGDRHVRHDELVRYFERLADASPRLHLEVTGRTHGGRPLLLAHFHADGSADRIDTLRDARASGARDGDGPLVVWLGYSVHGNEASGAPAAMQTAWYLAAARSDRVARLLEDAVVVIEPVLNPDGMDRFSSWVNDNRGYHPNADPNDREHREGWPNGRTNYYWFDLNRDWLPLVHPESQARLDHYYRWLPHVVTDVHEMRHHTTYFFQPGVPSRNNPLTPEENYRLTGELARYHARALDALGKEYFTEELFDDYYVGKGSTYPDLTGGIGILFEQAATRGHVMDTPHGQRIFHDAIRNQFATSLSTLEGAHDLADELARYQRGFFEDARAEGGRAGHAGWVLGDGGDATRAHRLVSLLVAHDLEVHPTNGPVTIDGREYARGWVVPAAQAQYRLARSLLDPATEFPSEVFYDVSTWWLPAIHDVPVTTASRLPAHARSALQEVPMPSGRLPADDDAVAWLIPWNQQGAPAALDRLLEAGAVVRVAKQPLQVDTDRGTRSLLRGALVLPTGADQPDLDALLQPLVGSRGLTVYSTDSGLTLSGPDLGAPSLPVLEPIRPLLVTGRDLNPLSAGQIWHWFDTFLDRPLTRVEWTRLHTVDLGEYTHVLLPDGDYTRLQPDLHQQLVAFVEGGGVLVANQAGADFASHLPFAEPLSGAADPEAVDDTANDEAPPEARAYDDHEIDQARLRMAGAILEMAIDVTHPLGFGHERDTLPVFRRGLTRLEPGDNPYSRPGRYTADPVLSGYMSEQRREQLAGIPALLSDHRGHGVVIRIADDALFRGFHAGTWRLFANALYFGPVIQHRTLPD